MNSCKHCGKQAERATTTTNQTVVSDCCYGCRMRYDDAHKAIINAKAQLNTAFRLMEMEDTDINGIQHSNAIAAVLSQLDGIDSFIYPTKGS